jgi:hypothetical protein
MTTVSRIRRFESISRRAAPDGVENADWLDDEGRLTAFEASGRGRLRPRA